MDLKDSRKQSLELARSMRKALKPNRLNNQIFRYISQNSPLYQDDNPESYLRGGYETNPDVYSVVNGITSASASVPFVVHKVVDSAKAQKYYRAKHVMRAGATTKQIEKCLQLKEEAFEEVDQSDDLYKLIERPNPLQAFPEWYENMKGFQLLTGNGYTHGIELTDGRIGEMWVMPAQWTRILASAKSSESLIRGYIIELYGHIEKSLEPETVMHWKYWNPNYDSPGAHLYGMSPLKPARNAMRIGTDGDTALSVAMRNNGASGMIYPEGDMFESFTPEQKSQMESYLRNRNSPQNYKTFLVMSTKMGYQGFGHPPIDLELIESGKMSQRDICNIYGYPSELLNDPDNKTNANKEQSRKQLYLDVVIPGLERDYAELNRFLTRPFVDVNGNKREARYPGYHIDYDVQAIDALQEDAESKVRWLKDAWWLTLDEKRAEMGKEEINDDSLYIPANLIPNGSMELNEEEIKALSKEYANSNPKAE